MKKTRSHHEYYTEIVAQEMRTTISDMTGPPMSVPFFSYDTAKEINKKAKLAKAARRILKYYSVPSK